MQLMKVSGLAHSHSNANLCVWSKGHVLIKNHSVINLNLAITPPPFPGDCCVNIDVKGNVNFISG